MPGRERARYLLRIARLLRERAPELAVLESLDSGKPIRQTRDVDLPLATAAQLFRASLLKCLPMGMVAVLCAQLPNIYWMATGRTLSFTAEYDANYDALAVLGTDLVKTLIVPRFLALGVMTVIFNYWNTLISILFQMVADMTVWHQSAAGFIATFSSNFTIPEVVFNGIKVLTFGFIIAIVCCYKGLNAKGGAAGVGRAVNQAVVISFCLIYVYNYMLNSLLLAAFPQTSTLR